MCPKKYGRRDDLKLHVKDKHADASISMTFDHSTESTMEPTNHEVILYEGGLPMTGLRHSAVRVVVATVKPGQSVATDTNGSLTSSKRDHKFN